VLHHLQITTTLFLSSVIYIVNQSRMQQLKLRCSYVSLFPSYNKTIWSVPPPLVHRSRRSVLPSDVPFHRRLNSYALPPPFATTSTTPMLSLSLSLWQATSSSHVLELLHAELQRSTPVHGRPNRPPLKTGAIDPWIRLMLLPIQKQMWNPRIYHICKLTLDLK
jgi:hypothetical protein